MTKEPSYKLPKEERLRGEIRVGNLFTQNKAFILYPFRIVFLKEEEKEDIQAKVLFGVPKKRFKRAVKRNRIRRQMKEAYRLNKASFFDFLTEKNISMQIGITYISNDEIPYAQIEKKMIEALQRLQEKIE